MPSNYSFTENGVVYNFDDVFVPSDFFRSGGILWTWGRNFTGQLGNPGGSSLTPVTTFSGGANWKQVSSGGYAHTAAIKTDGSLWIWGFNDFGQLGTNSSTSFVVTPVTTFAGGNNWKSVTVGESHTAAIKTDGTLWTWGRNSYGQLGSNSSANNHASTPVTTFIGGTTWEQVSCGSYHTAAIKTDGSLWGWGQNSQGQLAINNSVNRSSPVTTFAGGTNWKQVSSGHWHTAAIKTDGTLWVWGLNSFGALGNNTINTPLTPITTFSGGNNWKQVSCSLSGTNSSTTSAIKTDGTLWTWGRNAYGQLGINNSVNKSTPVTTFANGTNWKQVNSGNAHIVAIKTDGTLWTWGRNINGQLGINGNVGRSTPVTTFAGGTNWKEVSGGYGHTASIQYIPY